MGYSAYVICRNAKARDKMHRFLEEQVRPWHRLAEDSPMLAKYNPDYDYTRFPVAGEDISYGARRMALGYNFSSQGEAGGYLWNLLRFAALRVGKDRVIGGVKTRFTVYDGCEFFPVDGCDDNGFRGGERYTYDKRLDDEIDRIMANEMARLGKLWPAGVIADLIESTGGV
jgi:hypothetical protein